MDKKTGADPEQPGLPELHFARNNPKLDALCWRRGTRHQQREILLAQSSMLAEKKLSRATAEAPSLWSMVESTSWLALPALVRKRILYRLQGFLFNRFSQTSPTLSALVQLVAVFALPEDHISFLVSATKSGCVHSRVSLSSLDQRHYLVQWGPRLLQLLPHCSAEL